jgi:mannose-6-phosphate isomerase-like protein (cupin superfamily)
VDVSGGGTAVPAVGLELVNPVAGTRTVFRATAASTDGGHVEVEATYPPHSSPPPMHLHPQQDEHFTVLAGTMRTVVDGVERDLATGDVLDVPRGTPHLMWNPADEPAVMLWRTTPALRTDQLFCDLWQVAADNGFEPDLVGAFGVVQRYAEEFCLC